MNSKLPLLLTLLAAGALKLKGACPSDSPFSTVDHSTVIEHAPDRSATEFPLYTEQNSFLENLSDLSGAAPDFFVSSTSRHSFGDVYSIRGLTNGRLFTQPSLGVYEDGVPLGDSFTYSEPLFGLDHITLYRGPQTTLFGLGAPGGILDIETRHADPREWHGELSGLYGDFRTIEHRLWVGGPLIQDKLTLELSGFEGTNGGYIDNTTLHGRNDDRQNVSGRAVLTWTPTPDWRVVAGYEGSRDRDGSSRFTRFGSDPFQVRSDEPGLLNQETEREWLDLTKKFDSWQVRSITAHQSWRVSPLVQDADLTARSAQPATIVVPEDGSTVDALNSIQDLGTTTRLNMQQETWSQELRFESLPNAGSPWWRAGLFFQDKRTTGQNQDFEGETTLTDQLTLLPPIVDAFPGFPALGIPGSVFEVPNFTFQDTVRNVPVEDRTDFHLDSETFAAYVNGGQHWGAFAAEGGLRLTYTRQSFGHLENRSEIEEMDTAAGRNFDRAFDAYIASSSAAGPFQSVFVPPALRPKPGQSSTSFDTFTARTVHFKTHFSGEDDDLNFSPSLGLTYDLNKQIQLFGRTSYVTQPGGFNPLVTNKGFDRYPREQIWSTELGVRATTWKNRLQAQFTGYVNSIRDYQLDIGNTDYFIANAGRARALGLELEVACEPLPGLVFSGNFGLNQTELTQALPGKQAPFVPQYTVFTAVDYAHHSGFRAHTELTVIGDTDYAPDDFHLARQSAFGILNSRIGWDKGRYALYLFGRNLTDTKHYTQRTAANGFSSTGEPRVLGVMAIARF